MWILIWSFGNARKREIDHAIISTVKQGLARPFILSNSFDKLHAPAACYFF